MLEILSMIGLFCLLYVVVKIFEIKFSEIINFLTMFLK